MFLAYHCYNVLYLRVLKCNLNIFRVYMYLRSGMIISLHLIVCISRPILSLDARMCSVVVVVDHLGVA